MSNKEHDFTEAEILRMNAEKQLTEKLKFMKIPVTETDVQKLLHELQVHQIELEMQNDELRLANETAEKALRKYTMLYDFAPMGYFTLDADGTIEDLNFTGAELLGDRRFSFVGSNFKLFISDASKEAFSAFLDTVYAGNAKESCEVMLGYSDSLSRNVYMEGIVTGEERNCLLSVVDVSGFKK